MGQSDGSPTDPGELRACSISLVCQISGVPFLKGTQTQSDALVCNLSRRILSIRHFNKFWFGTILQFSPTIFLWRKLFPLFAPYINTQLENSMGNKTQITTLWRYLMIHYYHSTNIQLTPCKVENVNKNNGSMRVSYEWIWNQISAASGPCCKWAWKLNGATMIQNQIIQLITVSWQ